MTSLRYRRATGLGAVVAALAIGSLTACGSDAGAAPTREYTLALHTTDDQDHYKYVADGPIDLRAGDRVTFELTNTGQFPHDLVVVDPAGNAMAKADPVNPGGTLDLTVDFTEPGFYRLRCNFGNHLTQHDMQVVVEVKQADGTSA